jgi:hypothetical protein
LGQFYPAEYDENRRPATGKHGEAGFDRVPYALLIFPGITAGAIVLKGMSPSRLQSAIAPQFCAASRPFRAAAL